MNVYYYISYDDIPYQVATPSLARMSGSFCLVRLLNVFKPVSNPLGLTHLFPETLPQAPFDPTLTALTGRTVS